MPHFSLKQYVVTLDETVQMRGHHIHFYAKLTKIIPYYHQILPLIYSSGHYLEPNRSKLAITKILVIQYQGEWIYFKMK